MYHVSRYELSRAGYDSPFCGEVDNVCFLTTAFELAPTRLMVVVVVPNSSRFLGIFVTFFIFRSFGAGWMAGSGIEISIEVVVTDVEATGKGGMED